MAVFNVKIAHIVINVLVLVITQSIINAKISAQLMGPFG